MIDSNFFNNPTNPMQKKYEALRACYVDKLSDKEVAEKYGYSYYGFKTIKRDCKKQGAEYFFQNIQRGRPEGISDKTKSLSDRIVELRKKNYSILEIREKLSKEGKSASDDAIAKILKEEGFVKLFRRTQSERLEALQSDKVYPETANITEFGRCSNFTTNFGGLFLFIPLLTELNLPELFEIKGLYGSKVIPRLNYMLSYLALKLLGKKRLCHINDLSFDNGLGTFAGLNVLPKSTAISSYSYRHTASLVEGLLKTFSKILYDKQYIEGANVNLDFHSIPFYGDEPTLENHWVPTRGKGMKSVLSFFAQDLDTTFLIYSNGDIKNDEANDEILNFVNFYKTSTGIQPQCLIFDSKLTTYKNLYKLNKMGVKFITLGRRGKDFANNIKEIKEWNGVRLEGVTREYKNLKYFKHNVKMRDYPDELNEIIVKGNGRLLPMRLITNDFETNTKNILQKYAKRWRIENNIEENVDFFSLNALSSPVIVQVNFDIAMTLIANSLYKILAQKSKWMVKAKPKTIARNIIDTKAKIKITDNEVIVRLANRTYNPVFRDWVESLNDTYISWWYNRKLIFRFD